MSRMRERETILIEFTWKTIEEIKKTMCLPLIKKNPL